MSATSIKRRLKKQKRIWNHVKKCRILMFSFSSLLLLPLIFMWITNSVAVFAILFLVGIMVSLESSRLIHRLDMNYYLLTRVRIPEWQTKHSQQQQQQSLVSRF